ncbi:aspartic peptidase A1 [Amanita muscaria]
MRSLITVILCITVLQFSVIRSYGILIPFDINFGNVSPASSRLGRRTPISVTNTGNAQYSANMTVGGSQVRVLLDTGSSDLWVNFPGQTPNTADLGKSLTLNYAIGKASGDVHSATVGIGNFSLDSQAFLLVTDTSTFTTDIHGQGYDGLFGLGNNDGSVIQKKLGSSANSFLDRVFSSNKQTSNYITIMLDRKFDPGETHKGQLTISELVPGYENITQVPKLDVDKVNRLLKGDQHWQALTDKNIGIIGPDNQPIQIKSVVPSAPDGQLVAVFDSGFTFSQVPRDVADAIYGRVQGAQYDEQNQYWTVPCGQYLNVSLNFGGTNFPMHPLDTVDDNFHITNPSGNSACIGTFQPITTAFSMLGHYDMILGMNFLRNVYSLLDYGDWTGSNSRDKPFIQLMSITSVQNAKQDFIQVRLSGSDTTGNSRWTLLPASQIQHSPVSEAEKKRQYQEWILSRWPYIFIGCFIFVLLMIGLCIWRCCCRRDKDGRRRCTCCCGRDKKGGMGQLEKGGLGNPVGKPSANHNLGRAKGEGMPSTYIPLEDQQDYGHKSPPVVDDYDYSAHNMPSPPPAAYGSYGSFEYDQDPYQIPTRASVHPYSGNQSSYSSSLRTSYPPGLEPSDSPGHPPNNGRHGYL